MIINCNLITATSELLNTTATNLVKTSAELSNVKRDLTIKLEGIIDFFKVGENWISKSCCTGTKQELDKTKIELEKTRAIVDGLSTKLNGIFWLYTEQFKKTKQIKTYFN